MSELNKRVVTTFLAAMGKGDATTAATCLAPDAQTVVKGYGKFTGVRHFDQIVGTIGALKKLIPGGLSPTIHTITAEGERVVAEFEGNAELVNGKSYCNQYCMVFTLQDGKIKSVNEYFCTLLADEALYPLIAELESSTLSR